MQILVIVHLFQQSKKNISELVVYKDCSVLKKEMFICEATKIIRISSTIKNSNRFSDSLIITFCIILFSPAQLQRFCILYKWTHLNRGVKHL